MIRRVKMKCKICKQDADFVVQWGPKAENKECACERHIGDILNAVNAGEMWVAKVQKA